MKLYRKINHYLRYLIGLLLQNPKLVIKEIIDDYRKDSISKKQIKDNHLIWVCSLPKSGSTLVEEILEYYPYVKLNRSLNRFYSKGLVEHSWDISAEMFESAPKNNLSFIKTHTHYQDKFYQISKEYNAKIILTFRDLRDVMISRYFHIINNPKHVLHTSFKSMNQKQGFIASFQSNTGTKHNNVLSEYYEWIINWKYKKKSINCLELWYEDYILNPDIFINKIINFVNNVDNNRNCDLPLIKEYLEKKKIKKSSRSFFKMLNDRSKNVSTFRSGKINNWKSFFDDEITKNFNKSLPGPLEEVIRKI